mgnify:CR=1 FL=1|jgi:DNA-3-methyladenine glycosylase II
MDETAAAFERAGEQLAQLDDDWAWLVEQVGPCRIELHPAREPFEALVRAVAYQQLHGRAAEAIVNRLLALFPAQAFPEARQLLALEDGQLRACGFSGRKVQSLLAIAQARLDGLVPDNAGAREMDDAELVARLTQLPGVGRWTVEMLLIFSLGRLDILPVDDFGVREGYRKLKGLERQPTPGALAALGQQWSPQRSAAAWYLWRVPPR